MPARHTERAVLARATAPIESMRVPLELEVGGARFGGMWLYSEGRTHLLARDPLGSPMAVLRADRGVVSFEVPGEREVVALDAEHALQSVSGLDLEDLARLVFGRLPRDVESLQWTPTGWAVVRGGFVARLDREGTVRSARVGDFALVRQPDRTWLYTAVGPIGVRLGEGEPAVLPERAFAIDQGSRPATSLERAASEWMARWAGEASSSDRW